MVKKMNGDERLCDKVIPKDFNPGCRRPTPAPGYLEALVAPNATIFTDHLEKVTEKGFIDVDGQEHEVDVIICATGFDTSWVPRFPFINGKGIDIKDLWTPQNVTSYLSIGVPTFPNVRVLNITHTRDNTMSYNVGLRQMACMLTLI